MTKYVVHVEMFQGYYQPQHAMMAANIEEAQRLADRWARRHGITAKVEMPVGEQHMWEPEGFFH